MSLMGNLNISASALTAQQLRMDVLSQNMANVDTTRTEAGGPYKRKTVLFQERKTSNSFINTLNNAVERRRLIFGEVYKNSGVSVQSIAEDTTQGPMVYDPSHPDANEEGYVEKPNVNVVMEMVDLISASRSYEANVTALNVTKSMINKTFEISSRA